MDATETKKPVEMTPDDLADEEWGPAKAKGKKGKKGKAAKGKAQADEEEEEDPGQSQFIPCLTVVQSLKSLSPYSRRTA